MISTGSFLKSRLAKKQLLFILVFSSTITLLGTLIQLFIEYRTDAAYIQEQFQQIKQAHLASLTWSLWKFDNVQINTQLNSILSLRDIIHIEIRDKGKVLYQAGDAGKKSMTKSTQYEMVYNHNGVKEVLGTLKVTASFEGLVQRMRNRIFIILFTQGLKTFFVSLFILYIINRLVIRHMGTISDFAKRLQSETLDSQLLLDRPPSRNAVPDELDQIVTSINDMRVRLIDDISKIKKAEEALKESEERFRLAFDADAIGRAITGTDGFFLRTNRCLTDMLGYSAEEFSRLSYADITYAEDLSASKRCVRCLLAKECDTYRLEKRYVRKDGSIMWAEVNIVLIFDEHGMPMHFISGIQDISEHKHAEEALKASEEKYRSLFETLPIGMYRMSPEGRILDVNSALVEVLKYPDKESLLGIDSKDMYIDTKERNQWTALIKSKKVVTNYVKRIRTYDAQMIWVEENARALFDSEKRIKCFEGSIINITDRIKAEEKKAALEAQLRQAQKMESIGNLAGGIAHDFNNILFPIIGMSELLLGELVFGSSERENIEEIFKAGKRGRDLVKQILAFSRQAEHQKVPTRIQNIIEEVLKLSRSSLPSYIEINHEIQSDCGLVLADPTQIHQVVMNIITNAYHAVETEGGKITVRLSEKILGASDLTGSSLDPGKYAFLSISDTGHGIPPELIEKIFDPYFTTKEKGKGTGLGLAVVYGIIQEHKGDIRVRSEVGKGATFDLYLPMMDRLVDPEPIGETQGYPRGNERILIVDDEASIVNLEKLMLERLGYRITPHVNSIEALEVFKTNPSSFDLVITDMTMPRMTGVNLAKELLSIRVDIPVIICTGFSEKVDAEKAMQLGISGFLMKPVILSELAKMVREVIDKGST